MNEQKRVWQEFRDVTYEETAKPGQAFEAVALHPGGLEPGDVIVGELDHVRRVTNVKPRRVTAVHEIGDVQHWTMFQIMDDNFCGWGLPVHGHQSFLVLRAV